MAKTKEKLTCKQALAELKANGTDQNTKIFRNHGVTGELFGVSYAFLKKFHKRVGTDHGLALELWETGNHDARIFACWVADADKVTIKMLEGWARDVDNHVIAIEVVALAQDSDLAAKLMRKWIAKRAEWPSVLGWGVFARLVLQPDRDLKEGGLEDAEVGELLERIVATLHDAPNRTRHNMNQAVIAVGCRPGWKAKALAAAKQIGKVEVDYGKTSCKADDAVAKINKTLDHYKKKGRRPVDGTAGQRRRHC
ncbi:MAG: DNA alkylation repair protein [Planctomycetota bacterium]|nr:DNA alkylation repair protein [Planctomycetota bacterium]